MSLSSLDNIGYYFSILCLGLLTDSSPEEDKEKSDGVEDMVGRDPEDKLEIEGVELCDEEEDGDAEDGHPPLETGQRVPGELNPTVGGKLTKEPLDLASECWDLIQASPVVGLHPILSIYLEWILH